jgi:hypothetical protein
VSLLAKYEIDKATYGDLWFEFDIQTEHSGSFRVLAANKYHAKEVARLYVCRPFLSIDPVDSEAYSAFEEKANFFFKKKQKQ